MHKHSDSSRERLQGNPGFNGVRKGRGLQWSAKGGVMCGVDLQGCITGDRETNHKVTVPTNKLRARMHNN